jgi:4-amino-4-deoxy-L-arabinose transferase-like glycosyltransferase
VTSGDWIVPTLAGGPFMEKPPIFYLTAAGFVKLCSPWLQPHDAARLASAFYMLLTMLFMGLAARELFGKDHISPTLLLLIGSVGLQVTAHKLITDNALVAGVSAAIYGFALCGRRPVVGGFWIGTGAGLGFMAKGLLAPGLIALIAVALFVFFRDWRNKITPRVRIAAYVAVLPWFVIWPAALYSRSPALFQEWFLFQNLGRFFGVSFVGREFTPLFYFMHLPWFALPSLPIALWAAWHYRGEWKEHAGTQLPLVMFLVMLTVFSLSSSIRNIYALPLLLPLSLLAAMGCESMPERAKTVMNRIALVLFGLLAAVLWIGWIINLKGALLPLARWLHHAQPDYVPAFSGLLFTIAGIYTIMWIFAIVLSSRYAHFYLMNWTAGIVLVWGLLMTIWLPWMDVGSSFRPQFMSLREHIPARGHSVMTLGLGESENALLEYYTGVMPRPIMDKPEHVILASIAKNSNELSGIFEFNRNLSCDWLLVQNIGEREALPPGADWEPVWEVRRPSNPEFQPRETFTLLKRNGGKKLCD